MANIPVTIPYDTASLSEDGSGIPFIIKKRPDSGWSQTAVKLRGELVYQIFDNSKYRVANFNGDIDKKLLDEFLTTLSDGIIALNNEGRLNSLADFTLQMRELTLVMNMKLRSWVMTYGVVFAGMNIAECVLVGSETPLPDPEKPKRPPRREEKTAGESAGPSDPAKPEGNGSDTVKTAGGTESGTDDGVEVLTAEDVEIVEESGPVKTGGMTLEDELQSLLGKSSSGNDSVTETEHVPVDETVATSDSAGTEAEISSVTNITALEGVLRERIASLSAGTPPTETSGGTSSGASSRSEGTDPATSSVSTSEPPTEPETTTSKEPDTTATIDLEDELNSLLNGSAGTSGSSKDSGTAPINLEQELTDLLGNDDGTSTPPKTSTPPIITTPPKTSKPPIITTPPVGEWKCSCGWVNKTKFCPKCGNKREWICPNCKTERTTIFCPKCGHKRI